MIAGEIVATRGGVTAVRASGYGSRVGTGLDALPDLFRSGEIDLTDRDWTDDGRLVDGSYDDGIIAISSTRTQLYNNGFSESAVESIEEADGDMAWLATHADEIRGGPENPDGVAGELVARATVLNEVYDGENVEIIDNVYIDSGDERLGEFDHVVLEDGEVIAVWETKASNSPNTAESATDQLEENMQHIEDADSNNIEIIADNHGDEVELELSQFNGNQDISQRTIGASDGPSGPGDEAYDETMPITNEEFNGIADDDNED
jgi:hypothetical protein